MARCSEKHKRYHLHYVKNRRDYVLFWQLWNLDLKIQRPSISLYLIESSCWITVKHLSPYISDIHIHIVWSHVASLFSKMLSCVQTSIYIHSWEWIWTGFGVWWARGLRFEFFHWIQLWIVLRIIRNNSYILNI